MDTSLPVVIAQPPLEESIPLKTQPFEATAHITLDETNPIEVFPFLSLSLKPLKNIDLLGLV